MQITLEADYAVRCMVYLKDHPGELSALGDISSAADIPSAFLSKILQKLARRGLVASKKGKNGGFRLALPPERVSVLDILLAVSGGPEPLKIVCSRGNKPCRFLKTCKIHGVWTDLGRTVGMMLGYCRLSQL